MYGDINMIPLLQQESGFRKDMDSLENHLQYLKRVGSDEFIMRMCVEKVTACLDSLSGPQAVDLLSALVQMLNILGARCNEIRILQDFVTDPKYVNPQALADFVQSPAHQSSCNLGEYLTPFVEHLLPPGSCG
jgi:hypothetical protein